jgi:hypothetical protein
MDEKYLLFLESVEDLVNNLLYYDRKEDEELTKDDVENLLESGKITIEEVTDHFKLCLKDTCKVNFNMPSRKEEEEADVTGP